MAEALRVKNKKRNGAEIRAQIWCGAGLHRARVY